MLYLAVLYFILKLISDEFEMLLLRSLGVENKTIFCINSLQCLHVSNGYALAFLG